MRLMHPLHLAMLLATLPLVAPADATLFMTLSPPAPSLSPRRLLPSRAASASANADDEGDAEYGSGLFSPPPLSPPSTPPLIIEAAPISTIVTSLLAVIITAFALLRIMCCCCCRPRGPSILAFIALGAVPANVARIVSGVGAILPDNSNVTVWLHANEWECHLDGIVDDYATNERNCAGLSLAQTLSISAPLWAAALAVYLMVRSCSSRRGGWLCSCLTHVMRWLICLGLPLFACALLAFDRSCDMTNRPRLPAALRSACNAIHAPHFHSWAELMRELTSRELGTRGGDYAIALLFTPCALAVLMTVLALIFGCATCCKKGPRPESREPLGASVIFLALALPVWLLPVCLVAARKWLVGAHTRAALPWLALAADALFPAIGLLAAGCWLCCGWRSKRASTSESRQALSEVLTEVLDEDVGGGGGGVNDSTARASGGINSSVASSTRTGSSSFGGTWARGGGSVEASERRAPLLQGSRLDSAADPPPGPPPDSAALRTKRVSWNGRAAESDGPSSERRPSGARPMAGDSHPPAANPFGAGGDGPGASSCHTLSLPADVPRAPAAKAGWLNKEGHSMGYKGWKRRWCVVEDGLFQYFESFDSARDQPLGLVPLQGASIRQPKTARANRPSIVGPTVGPAWRLDTAATGNDKFHQKCAAPPLSLSPLVAAALRRV